VLRCERPRGVGAPADGRDDQVVPPRPGHVSPGFMAEAGRCWRLVYDHNLQSTHCLEPPTWTGRWFSPRGDRWWRVWSCPDHLDGLTGLREFGRVNRR
jgi:hypothetical protein